MKCLNLIHISENKSLEEEANFLGQAFGFYLGAIEYGIANPDFWGQAYIRENYKETITNTNKQIAAQIKRLGKKIKLDFIKRRLLRITRLHGTKMSPDQKKFIVQLAADFA